VLDLEPQGTLTFGSWYFEVVLSSVNRSDLKYLDELTISLYCCNQSGIHNRMRSVAFITLDGLISSDLSPNVIFNMGAISPGDTIGCLFRIIENNGIRHCETSFSINSTISPFIRYYLEDFDKFSCVPGLKLSKNMNISINFGEELFSFPRIDVSWEPLQSKIQSHLLSSESNWGYEFEISHNPEISTLVTRNFEMVWKKPDGLNEVHDISIWR